MKAVIRQPDGNITMQTHATRNKIHCLPTRITVKTKTPHVANKTIEFSFENKLRGIESHTHINVTRYTHIYKCHGNNYTLKQRFSTWGTGTPGGTRTHLTGYEKLTKN
jgi:hypothetical protein